MDLPIDRFLTVCAQKIVDAGKGAATEKAVVSGERTGMRRFKNAMDRIEDQAFFLRGPPAPRAGRQWGDRHGQAVG